MSSVREHFDAKSDRYYDYAGKPTNSPHRVKHERLETALNWGDWHSHDRALSVGCGPAPLLSMLQQYDLETVGVDISREMISAAEQGAGGSGFVQADSLSLPFADGSFDGVVALGLLLYIESPEDAIAELGRAVAPGGQLIFNWNNPGLANRVRRAYQRLRRVGKRVTGWGSIDGHRKKLQAPSAVYAWVRDAGFVIQRTRYINGAPGLTRTPVERDLGRVLESLPGAGYVTTTGILAANKRRGDA